MREELEPTPLRHHDRHPWAQPGDEPNRAWMMRFADPDMRTMVWTDEDAEQDARAAYAQYSPTWNVYLFATVDARAKPAPADATGLMEALKPFAGLYNQITRDHGLDWFADEGQVMRAALAYPVANGAIVWRHFRLAAEALAAFQSRQEEK